MVHFRCQNSEWKCFSLEINLKRRTFSSGRAWSLWRNNKKEKINLPSEENKFIQFVISMSVSGASLLMPVTLILFDSAAPSSSILLSPNWMLSGYFPKGLRHRVGKFRAIICLDLSLFKWVALMRRRRVSHMCGYEKKTENHFDWNFLPEYRRGISKAAPFMTTSVKKHIGHKQKKSSRRRRKKIVVNGILVTSWMMEHGCVAHQDELIFFDTTQVHKEARKKLMSCY